MFEELDQKPEQTGKGGHAAAPSIWTLTLEMSEGLREAGIEDPRREARALLALALQRDLADLLAHPNERLSDLDDARVRRYYEARVQRRSLAHIHGSVSFWGRVFSVGRDLLVPRPESELLIERSLAWVQERIQKGMTVCRILDLCAGTGALGLSLALDACAFSSNLNVALTLLDLNPEAISVARTNASALGLPFEARLLEMDLFSDQVLGLGRFDVILCNPPYIPSAEVDELMPEVSAFESRMALDGGVDGLDFYRRLACLCPVLAARGGSVWIEHGFGQSQDLVKLFDKRQNEIWSIQTWNDMTGKDRMISLQIEEAYDLE